MNAASPFPDGVPAGAAPQLADQIDFDLTQPRAALDRLPTAMAVFALYGAPGEEPYLGRTPNLKRRLERLLTPSAGHTRRLQLAGRVRRIGWRRVGSDFEALLTQFALLEELYGPDVLERMHLRAPALIRFYGANPFPRIGVSTRPSQRELDWAYGPFLSRAAAERFAEESLKLFLLRRCTEELAPRADHPGCAYGEMKMCLEPCKLACTPARYAAEAAAVERFLATRGASRRDELSARRAQASEALEFELAALLHAQVQRVEAVQALAPELVSPLGRLRALLLLPAAEPGFVACFLMENGSLRGPAGFSLEGMRIQNEHSGSTSLFAHPVLIEAIVEPEPASPAASGALKAEPAAASGLIATPPASSSSVGASGAEASASEAGSPDLTVGENSQPDVVAAQRTEPSLAGCAAAPPDSGESSVSASATRAARRRDRDALEVRLEAVLAELEAPQPAPTPTRRQGHLALLKRWYYRPEARRVGEVFFPAADGQWPLKAILRGLGRVYLGAPPSR